MVQGEMGIGIIGRRQVTTRWLNDPVWMHDGIIQESGQEQVRAPPPRRKSGRGKRRWRAERDNNNGVAYVTINDGS